MKKKYIKQRLDIYYPIVFCILTVLLAACTSQQSSGNTSPSSSTLPLVQSGTQPALQTSCPANGTARAAIMTPLSLGKRQNLVYIYNEVPANTSTAFGHLERYDVAAGKKTEIVTSGIAIQSAQVSADGQWVLFISTPDPRGDPQHSGMLQLVRVDGQQLQTLFCFPHFTGTDSATFQWSSDEKSVLLTVDSGDTTSVITLLDMHTGNLHVEISITDPQQMYRYSVLTWIDNQRAYVLKSGREAPAPPVRLYLLDTKTNQHPDGSDLKFILEHGQRFNDLSFVNSIDSQTLYGASCLQVSDPFDSTIWQEPTTGGTQKTIYHQAHTICINRMRVVSATTFLLLVTRTNDGGNTYTHEIWTMNINDGKSTILYLLPPAPPDRSDTYNFNTYNQYTWSNVSRDGLLYSYQLDTNDSTTITHQLFIGPLSGGGVPQAIDVVKRGSVSLVGWTTM